MTLDALVGRYGLPLPGLLKIDVDGLEGEILAGAERLLSSPVLRTILVEVNVQENAPSRAEEQTLARHGFALHGKSEWVWEQNGMKSQNYIFNRR